MDWIFADGSLQKAALGVGRPTVIAKVEGEVSGVSWGDHDLVVFASTATHGLWRVGANGGDPTVLTRPAVGELDHFQPYVLPGARAVAFDVRGPDPRIAVLTLATGAVRQLAGGGRPHFASSGPLIFSDRSLVAMPFSLDQLESSGPSLRLMEVAGWRPGNAAEFAVSNSGTLVYGPGGDAVTTDLVMIDRSGNRRRLSSDSTGGYYQPRLSPDGRRVAFEHAQDVWIFDQATHATSRLTSEEGTDAMATWAPDGDRITYVSTKQFVDTMFWRPANGNLPRQPVPHGVGGGPLAWSSDGTTLITCDAGAGVSADLWALRLDGAKPPRRITESLFYECDASLSPDGRWLAYSSNESGRFEVYVRPFSGPENRWRVSVAGGREPAWSRNGRELFFIVDDWLHVVDVRPGPTYITGTSQPLFRIGSGIAHHPRSYDVHPDGQLSSSEPNECPIS